MMEFAKTHFIIFLLLMSVVLLSFFGFLFINDLYFKIESRPPLHNRVLHHNTKYILYWLPMWQKDIFSYGSSGNEQFQHCAFKNCFATQNRGYIPMNRYDAIVFDGAQYFPTDPNPWIRTPKQRYIFATMESPLAIDPVSLKWYPSFYNWTMTYRLDSDIPIRYGYIIKNNTNYKVDLEFINNKTRLAAWLVSNCESTNHREEVYNKLRKVLEVDVYGSCGTFKCPGESSTHKGPSEPCYDFIAQTYKFYLSFENAHCKDYVTEKLYMALERNIVPIVYGFADYEYFAPPNSVIVADKFQSITELADYIFYLDQNSEAYLKYFEWKRHYYVNRYLSESACKLCEMLNDPLQPQKVYKDIFTWWLGANKSYHCKFVSFNYVQYIIAPR